MREDLEHSNRGKHKAELKYILLMMKLCFSNKYQYLIKEPDISDVLIYGKRNHVNQDISTLSLLIEFNRSRCKGTHRMLFDECKLTKNQKRIILFLTALKN